MDSVCIENVSRYTITFVCVCCQEISPYQLHTVGDSVVRCPSTQILRMKNNSCGRGEMVIGGIVGV